MAQATTLYHLQQKTKDIEGKGKDSYEKLPEKHCKQEYGCYAALSLAFSVDKSF